MHHHQLKRSRTYRRRLEQYDRAAMTSESVIREAYDAGAPYGVVAYVRLIRCNEL